MIGLSIQSERMSVFSTIIADCVPTETPFMDHQAKSTLLLVNKLEVEIVTVYKSQFM